MDNIIEIKNLKKSFKDVKAVDKLSFNVKRGEFFAFLGVNGAGKSTTISMMCGMLQKDDGSIIIDGKDVEKELTDVIAKTGVVFQNSVLDGALSVKDNLLIKASLYGMSDKAAKERVNYLAEALDFSNFLTRTVSKLSGGQRRRIDMARALINSPELLILDEPTTGLDPQTRKLLWKVIDDLRKKEKMTVFLTTHYMEEASEADYIVILDSGKIVAEGTPLDLKNNYTGDFVFVYGNEEEDIKNIGCPYEKIANGFKISVKNTAEVKNLIINNPNVFNDFEITKGKMDDVFLAVTGKKLAEEN